MPMEDWVKKSIRSDFVSLDNTRADRTARRLFTRASDISMNRTSYSTREFEVVSKIQEIDKYLLHRVQKYLKENKTMINDEIDEDVFYILP